METVIVLDCGCEVEQDSEEYCGDCACCFDCCTCDGPSPEEDLYAEAEAYDWARG